MAKIIVLTQTNEDGWRRILLATTKFPVKNKKKLAKVLDQASRFSTEILKDSYNLEWHTPKELQDEFNEFVDGISTNKHEVTEFWGDEYKWEAYEVIN